MLRKEDLPECPIATTVQLIGNKWKLLILRNLRMRPWRFNELQKSLTGISQKVLTENLRAMESDGIIVRTVYAEVPPRSFYLLETIQMINVTNGIEYVVTLRHLYGRKITCSFRYTWFCCHCSNCFIELSCKVI